MQYNGCNTVQYMTKCRLYLQVQFLESETCGYIFFSKNWFSLIKSLEV